MKNKYKMNNRKNKYQMNNKNNIKFKLKNNGNFVSLIKKQTKIQIKKKSTVFINSKNKLIK